jgi:molybdopterin synthase catalytic subunit
VSEAGVRRKGEIDLPKLLERFRQKLDNKSGAIGCFIGVVRGETEDDEKVKLLHFESSDEATRKLEEIAAGAEREAGISHVTIYHIVDDLKPGEDVLYVLVGGEHRAEVFRTLSQVVNQVKSEAPIWKKEITETGEYWTHEF